MKDINDNYILEGLAMPIVEKVKEIGETSMKN